MAKPDYDFTSATFFFFKMFGRRPGSAITIAVNQLIAYGLIFAIAFTTIMPALLPFIEAIQSQSEPEPEAILMFFGQVWLIISFVSLAMVFVTLSVQGAWLRFLTDKPVGSFIALRFGGDELRLLVVNLAFIAFGIMGYILFWIVVVGLILGGAGLFDGNDSAATALGAGFIGFLLMLVFIVGVIFLMIRFAAAPAMTVESGKIRLFESFSATSGVSGWMFLSYLVLIMLILFGGLFLGFIQNIIILSGFMSSGIDMNSLVTQSYGSFDEISEMFKNLFNSPGMGAAIVLLMLTQIIFQIVVDGLWHGVGAYVAVRHSGGNAAAVEDISAPSESVGAAPNEG